MIVVKETSGGTVVLTFSYVSRSIGLTAEVGRVADQGWVGETVSWSSGDPSEGSLPDAIRKTVSIPRGEAEQVAEGVLRELHDRGGDKSELTRRDWLRAGALLTTGVGAILLAAIAAMAALAWITIRLF
jgi:hypothetical protein